MVPPATGRLVEVAVHRRLKDTADSRRPRFDAGMQGGASVSDEASREAQKPLPISKNRRRARFVTPP